jgi:hypothetical protein
MDIKKVYWTLFSFLTDRDLRPHTRNVSIQLQMKEHCVDLIPAYRDDSGYVLFNKRSHNPVHTDVSKHIHAVASSGRQQEICALKIWRERNSLDFPSFYLELTALHALESERFGQLADNVLTVLRHIGSHFEQITVRDPANSKNIVSDDLSATDKRAVARAARDVLYNENWKKMMW